MRTIRPSLILTSTLLAGALLIPATGRAQEKSSPDPILTVLAKEGNHTKFLQIIKEAGLDATLQGKGPYTIFAPTDEAFAKLPKDEFDKLMADPAALKALVSLHVTGRSIHSGDVTAPMNVATLEGNNVRLLREGKTLKLQVPAAAAEMGGGKGAAPKPINATVVKADVAASNGVVHDIDTVLLGER